MLAHLIRILPKPPLFFFFLAVHMCLEGGELIWHHPNRLLVRYYLLFLRHPPLIPTLSAPPPPRILGDDH